MNRARLHTYTYMHANYVERICLLSLCETEPRMRFEMAAPCAVLYPQFQLLGKYAPTGRRPCSNSNRIDCTDVEFGFVYQRTEWIRLRASRLKL